MKTKHYFLSLFSTAVLIALFVSCSTNNEEQQIPRTNAQTANRINIEEFNKPHGRLIIINNTDHVFEKELICKDVIGPANTFPSYSLSQNIRISANTTVTLKSFHSTFTEGVNINNDDKWFVYSYATNTITGITGLEASNPNFPQFYHMYMPIPTNTNYVLWYAMSPAHSTDGLVTLSFKLDYFGGEVAVNGIQTYLDGNGDTHNFGTKGIVDTNGDTTITMYDVID